MSRYLHIKRCLELSDRDIAAAVASRDSCKALLDRLSEISKPGDGAPKLLLLFARMATTACEWLDGGLSVEIVGDGEVCVVELMDELAGGLRERVLPAFSVNAPLIEFVGAVERVPHLIAPLVMKRRSSRRIVFSATEEIRRTTTPPPVIAIADESLAPPWTPSAPSAPRSEDAIEEEEIDTSWED